jgi:two-component system, OmpR family, sensor histidine kinase BaeS
MKLSLTLKLTLAFLFVSIIGVVLTAVFVRQRAGSEFDRFVLDRYQLDLLDDLAQHYRQSGSWDDISAIIVRMPRRFGHGPEMAAGPEMTMLAPVTLVDADGLVVYGGRQYRSGQQAPSAELNRAAPVDVDGETVGWVIFADLGNTSLVGTESPESVFLANLNRAVILGALGAILIALLLGIFLARTISGPVREVTDATRMVAGGELGFQVPVRTRDELGVLAASFNQMSTDLARANDLRRQMTADIAHDLRGPLSVILGYMEALSTKKLEPTPEALQVIYAKGRHLQHLIDDLRTLALADAGELSLTRRPVEPGALLEHAALAHLVEAQERGIDIRVKVGRDLPQIEADPERMAQVLGNLVGNALRHTPEGGQINLAAVGSDGSVLLQVSDTGAGIDAADMPHIFDRFYRGDRSRQQTGESGLGLAIARSLVEAHGGTIRATSTVGVGSTFIITLPAAANQTEPLS